MHLTTQLSPLPRDQRSRSGSRLPLDQVVELHQRYFDILEALDGFEEVLLFLLADPDLPRSQIRKARCAQSASHRAMARVFQMLTPYACEVRALARQQCALIDSAWDDREHLRQFELALWRGPFASNERQTKDLFPRDRWTRPKNARVFYEADQTP